MSGFFSYIFDRWYIAVILAVLIALTVFMWIKAIISGQKRREERDRIIAQLENEKELRKSYEKNKELSKEDKAELRRKKRKEKFQNIINAKYAKTGATPPKEYEHMEANIEYIKDGGYYLIMYEKGFIRAWGAIKIRKD